MIPAYLKVLRNLSPAGKLANANSPFIMARDALYQQEIRRGCSPEKARRVAVQRMLDHPTD